MITVIFSIPYLLYYLTFPTARGTPVQFPRIGFQLSSVL